MAQLLNKGINTIAYTNSVLRNQKSFNDIIILRSDNFNTGDFSTFSIFKDLALDLGRQVSAEIVTDVAIIKLETGKSFTLEAVDNRLVLCLENKANFSYGDKRFTPETGDLIWTNEKLTISNTSNDISILFIVDFKEFLL